eukprot:CAMPEP_0184865336 /NCGR_PEP_ID=MMETSP0580-20130426/17746_1 /TAXON_ID=1118495 /ORGANISM="Dactyliosolen fragilissimus" /LENGTH=944 /DNA_ID=CAMNT_0027364493 /DNA_START=76 /DNA_END=2910 /DNA_ORIENTATION=+
MPSAGIEQSQPCSILPSVGFATVKSVLSGDTVVLTGKPTTKGGKAPQVIFTFERVTSPRMASKGNGNIDEPGAFEAREWLRSLVIGKQVAFETRKQGASAADRVYGLLFIPSPIGDGTRINLAVEAVRKGHATPKVLLSNITDDVESESPESDPVVEYERALQTAHANAAAEKIGVHGSRPLVRHLLSSGEQFQVLELVEKSKKYCSGGRVKCIIEHIFDGSRLRMHSADPQLADAGLQYCSFTLLLGGISCPRVGNPRIDPPTKPEPFSEDAKKFVEMRLLHRELEVTLHGTDKGGICGVGTVHHPRGNIGIELLKNGLARVSDWSARLMDPLDIPAFRVAENGAKRANLGVWESYAPPQLTGSSEIIGTVIEVLTGDTLTILPNGENYDSESKLRKVSLASVRSPRTGNEKIGKKDEPYAVECKERLRVLTVGKACKVQIHYERDIPMGQSTEKRQFGTIAVPKRPDVSEILLQEGLAVTQRHRDDEEKSPRYDFLLAAESAATAAKKNIHSDAVYGKGAINDLTDPKKAKSYSGSLIRAGTLKAIVEFVFNGSRFKVFVPSENCHIVFALESLKCPQPSPSASAMSRGNAKSAEPFGDIAKRHARLNVHQRNVEIICKSVTISGIITGQLFVGVGSQRKDFSLEMVGIGLAEVDPRKIEYGEAPRVLVEAQNRATANKVGIWSLVQTSAEPTTKTLVKSKEEVATIQFSEICGGNHFFFHVVGDEALSVMDESMKLFTKTNGLKGAPCDLKVGKIVAALFDDGTGKSWYRAKIIEKQIGKVKVMFVDHGNVTVVPISTHLRPLDTALDTSRIPPIAKEAVLALTRTRGLEDDEGLEAARYLQRAAWGRQLTAKIFCETEGKLVVALFDPNDSSVSINEQMISEGLALTSKQGQVGVLSAKMLNSNNLMKLAADLNVAQEAARKTRLGMWRYGDIGDDDDEE